MSKMKKKLSSQKGETILETLVALLIIVLSITFLSGSIAKSTRVINDIKATAEDGFTYDGENEGGKKISDDKSVLSSNREVVVYRVPQYEGADQYYYYYEP